MNFDDFEKRFVTTARLLRRKSIGLEKSSMEIDPSQVVNNGSAQLCGNDTDPMILISLEKLEDALHGFRDTGTWGDYFYSSEEEGGDRIELSVPDHGGRANYKLDTSDDEGGSG